MRGPIAPEEVGVCMMHEHLWFDFTGTYWKEPENPADLGVAHGPILLNNRGRLNRNPFLIHENLVCQDADIAVDELGYYKQAGGSTIVEVTPIAHGRGPEGLKQVSERTGVHLVMSTGFYHQLGHPAYIAEKSIDELAQMMVKEINEGIEGTTVRAGFMGDVGTTGSVTANEQKVLRACARAHLETGVAIGIHIDPGAQEALTVAKILFEEGVQPDRIVMEHMDENPDDEYHVRVADTGVFVEFDTWGSEMYLGGRYYATEPKDTVRAAQTKFLIDRGYADQLLVAQDIWIRMLMRRYGGEGYDSFLTYGVPMLLQVGVTEEQIRMMTVDNARRALTVRV